MTDQRIRLVNHTRGIFLLPQSYNIAEGGVRRLVGAHPIASFSVRSRPGSALFQTVDSGHSLARFNGLRFVGADTVLYRNGVSAITGLNGNRLAMVPAQVNYAVPDFKFGGAPIETAPTEPDVLFICGGGQSDKIDGDGTRSIWGIERPASTDLLIDNTGTADPPAAGDYRIAIAFLNGGTGNWGDPNEFEGDDPTTDPKVPFNSNGTNDIRCRLNNLPADITGAGDGQITRVRLFVSETDGNIMYHLIDQPISSGTGTPFLIQNILQSNITSGIDKTFPYDPLYARGIPPPETRDVVGPHVGRLFLTRINLDGERGRLYYTQVNQYEYVGGFIDICSDNEEIQKAVLFGGRLFIFTLEKIYEIQGTTEPFIAVPISGAPGTDLPYCVTASPFGIFYVAHESVYLFDGQVSRKVGEQLEPVFRNLTIDKNIAPFRPVVGGWARDEYFISDNTQAYAYEPRLDRWRETKAFNGLFYEAETGKILACFQDKCVLFEEEGEKTDDGDPIEFIIEWPSLQAPPGSSNFYKRVALRINTQGQWCDMRIRLDDRELDWHRFRTGYEFETVEIPIMQPGRQMAPRIEIETVEPIEMEWIEATWRERGGL